MVKTQKNNVPTTGFKLGIIGLNFVSNRVAYSYMKKNNVNFIGHWNGKKYNLKELERSVKI
jgi:hypothetical protein